MQHMLDKHIATRRGIMCIHREKPYGGSPAASLAHSEAAQDRCVILPMYPQMTDDQVVEVVEALKVGFENQGVSATMALAS